MLQKNETMAIVESDVKIYLGYATTEIYTLSLHDALPIFRLVNCGIKPIQAMVWYRGGQSGKTGSEYPLTTTEKFKAPTTG